MSTPARFPTITSEALAALRARIGQPVRRPEPYIEVATRDAIRHWAHGIGDRNAFWAEAGMAPPTIVFALDRIVSGYVGGLPGIHAMYAGTDFRWHRAIREGDRIVGESVLRDVIEKPSALPSGRSSRSTARHSPTSAARSSARPTRGASGRSATPRASAASTRTRRRTGTARTRSSTSPAPTATRRSAAPSPGSGMMSTWARACRPSARAR